MKKFRTVNVDSRKGYDIWSETYDSAKNVIFHVEGDTISRMVAPVKNKNVLDACCGTGRISIELAKKGASVSGIDMSEEMIRIARVKADEYRLGIDFRRGNVQSLPYRSKSFDIVICNLALCHVKNLNRALSELNRVLKKNGIMLISDLHPFLCGKEGGTYFFDNGKRYRIRTFVHSYGDYFKLFKRFGFKLKDFIEYEVLPSHEKYYKDKKGYRSILGKPFYFILKLKKE